MSTILVLGGTGKVGRRIVARLHKAGLSPRVATRRPTEPDSVQFDWRDPASFAAALSETEAVFVVGPTMPDPMPVMRPFLDLAVADRRRKIVLLSASVVEEGGPVMGAAHAYLKEHAARWSVLRPSWFMQNFSEQQHRATIREDGTIYSATGDGKVGFIDADDIAAVAAASLTGEACANSDVVLTGPAAVSYDEAAEQISRVLGRPIRHVSVSQAQLADRRTAAGMERGYASVMAALDGRIEEGREDYVTSGVPDVTGRPATSFAAFAEGAIAAWR